VLAIIFAAATTPAAEPDQVQTAAASAPWWLQILLQALATGIFVLGAALITFRSVQASDRRKLEREDQRQWDNERKQAFVAIAAAISAAQLELHRVRSGSSDDRLVAILTVLEAAMTSVRDEVELLRIIASQPVIDAARALQERLAGLWQDALLSDLGAPTTDEMLGVPQALWKAFGEVDDLLDQLRIEIRAEIRVDTRR